MAELKHFGIPGMKWGRRRAQLPPASIQAQALHIARRDAGIVATRELLRHYGDRIPGATIKAGKAGVGLLKYSGTAAKGAGFTLKLLGKSAVLVGKGGKAYVKGAIKIARVLK